MEEASEARDLRPRSKMWVVAITSPKGGTGTTTNTVQPARGLQGADVHTQQDILDHQSSLTTSIHINLINNHLEE